MTYSKIYLLIHRFKYNSIFQKSNVIYILSRHFSSSIATRKLTLDACTRKTKRKKKRNDPEDSRK